MSYVVNCSIYVVAKNELRSKLLRRYFVNTTNTTVIKLIHFSNVIIYNNSRNILYLYIAYRLSLIAYRLSLIAYRLPFIQCPPLLKTKPQYKPLSMSQVILT